MLGRARPPAGSISDRPEPRSTPGRGYPRPSFAGVDPGSRVSPTVSGRGQTPGRGYPRPFLAGVDPGSRLSPTVPRRGRLPVHGIPHRLVAESTPSRGYPRPPRHTVQCRNHVEVAHLAVARQRRAQGASHDSSHQEATVWCGRRSMGETVRSGPHSTYHSSRSITLRSLGLSKQDFVAASSFSPMTFGGSIASGRVGRRVRCSGLALSISYRVKISPVR